MSRSRKKNPVVTDYSKSRKLWKRIAAKKVRHVEDVPDGGRYKRFADPWSICDWKFFWDPEPHVYFSNGIMKIIEPDPEWKVRMK